MDVRVPDCLARDLPAVDPDIESCGTVVPLDLGAKRAKKVEARDVRGGRQVEEVGHVGLGNHQAVTAGDRETVQDGDGVLVLAQNVNRPAERTRP
jgi:hypothetical protein